MTGAYISEEIWDKVSLYKILLGEWGLEILMYHRKEVELRVQSFIFSRSPHSLSFSLSLSLSLSHSYHCYEKASVKVIIMQVNVIHALKPEKWHNMQY